MNASMGFDGYQLHDPRCEALYYFATANAAAAKAEELGASRFQFCSASGRHLSVQKRSGQWVRADGKPLGVVQQRIDGAAYLDLATRAIDRIGNSESAVDLDRDRLHAVADIFALRSIQDPRLRVLAIEWMVKLASVSESYRSKLETANRVVSNKDLAELNAALAAHTTEA